MTWAVLQSARYAPPNGTGVFSATAAFGSNLSANSKIIAFFGLNLQPSVTSVQDTAGNPLTQLGLLHSQSQTLAAYAMDTPAGDVGSTTAVTVALGSACSVALVILEVSGLLIDNTTAMLDAAMATAAYTGASVSDAQPAYVTFAPGEFLVAFQTGFAGQTTTEPVGYTADANDIEGNTWLNCVPAYASSSGGAESGIWTTSGTTQPSLIGVLAFNPSSDPAVPIYAQNVDPPPRPPGFFPGFPGMPAGEPFQAWPYSTTAEYPVSGTPSYNSLVTTDSPSAWWKLSEASGTNCADSSGGAHPVTLAGSGGVLGNASVPAGMPQTTLAVTAATTAHSTYTPPQLAAVTAEIWFNQNGQVNSGDARLMADDATAGSSFQLVLHTAGANFFPAAIFSVAGTFVFPTSAITAPASGWVHLAATFDSTTVHLYQNGVEVGGTGAALTGPLPAPGNPVCLGGNDPWINAPFLGLLAQAAVYPKALSASQVLAHYTAGITAPVITMPVLQPRAPVTAPGWFPRAPGMPLGTPFRAWPVITDLGVPPTVTPGAAPAGLATAAGTAQDAALHNAPAGLATATGTARSPAVAAVTGIMAFAAHNDDDLAWMLPDIQHAVTAGIPVRVVYVTGGAGAGDTTTMGQRETGDLAAYATIAGVANAWTNTDAGVSGHAMPLYTLTANPAVTLVFMRITQGSPAAGQLQNAISGAYSSITTINGSSTYSSAAALVTAMQSLISAFSPAQVYAQDFAGNYGDGDHSDHHASAQLALQAATAWQAASGSQLIITAYEGYGVQYLTANVSAPDQTAKTAAIASYGTASGHVSDPPGYDIAHQYVTSRLSLPPAGPYLVRQAVAQHNGQAGMLTGSGTSTGSPAYATSAASEFLVSFYADGGGPTATAPTGWTGDANTQLANAAGNLGVCYKNSTNGAETGSWAVSSGAVPWNAITAAFTLSGSWSRLQSAVHAPASGVALESATVTMGVNCTAGSVLLAFVQFQPGIGAYAVSVKDGAANSFTKIAETQNRLGIVSSLWAIATPAGDVGIRPVITATSTAAGAYRGGMLVMEVSGINAVTDITAQDVIVTLPATSAPGNSLVLAGRTTAAISAGAAKLPTAITDSGGNTWEFSASPAASPPAIAFPSWSSAFMAWALNAPAGASAVTVTLPAGTAYAEMAVTEWAGGPLALQAAGTVDNSVAAAEIISPALSVPASAAVIGLAYPGAGTALIGLQPVPYGARATTAAPTGGVLPIGGTGFDNTSTSDAVNWAAWQVTTAGGTLAWDWGVAAASIQVAAVFAGPVRGAQPARAIQAGGAGPQGLATFT